MVTASEPASLPQRVGRYEIVGPLGSGGMGEVLRARTVGPAEVERFVALKRVRTDLASDPAFVHRFVEEARLAATLVHPSLVTVLDFGRDEDTYFIAMELVDGLDLGRALKLGGPMPPVLVAYVLRHVALGLAFLHDPASRPGDVPAVVHGDVKPANVLLGRAGVVKLADLGVARVLGPSGAGTSRAGTAAYMSPQRAAGGAATPADDVYALGLVALAALTGEHPDRGHSPDGAMTGPVPGLAAAMKRWPALAGVLEQSLANDPAPRAFAGRLLPMLDRASRELAGEGEVAPETALAAWLAPSVALVSGDRSRPGRAPSVRPGGPTGGATELSRMDTADLPAPDEPSPGVLLPKALQAAPASWSRDLRAGVLVAIALAAVGVIAAVVAGQSGEPPDSAALPSIGTASVTAASATATASPLVSTPVVGTASASGSAAREPGTSDPVRPGVSPVTATAAPERGFGFLSINTPGTWANVTVAGRSAVTPARLRLPAGRHVIKLHNPELGVRKEVAVTVRAGEEVTELVKLGAP